MIVKLVKHIDEGVDRSRLGGHRRVDHVTVYTNVVKWTLAPLPSTEDGHLTYPPGSRSLKFWTGDGEKVEVVWDLPDEEAHKIASVEKWLEEAAVYGKVAVIEVPGWPKGRDREG